MLRKKKKLRIITVILLIVSLLTGCISHTELSSRIIVQALSVDYEDGLFIVNVQYYSSQSPEGSTGGNSDGSEGAKGKSSGGQFPFNVQGEGSNIGQAIEEIQSKTGRPVLYGECQIILLGDGMTEKDLRTVLEAFIASFDSLPKIIVSGVEGKASDYLAVKYKDETFATNRLRRMIDSAHEDGISPISRLYHVMAGLCSPQGSTYIPVLMLDKEAESELTADGSEIFLSSGALIKDGKYHSPVDLGVGSGIQILINEAKETILSVPYDDITRLVKICDMKSKITPSFVDGQMVFNVDIKGSAEYVESHINRESQEKSESTKREAEKALVSRIMHTLETTVIEHEIDVINLYQVVRHKDYHMWLKVEEKWDELLPQSKFIVTADLNVRRYGISQ